MEPIMRGTTAECFKHFLGLTFKTDQMPRIAEFIGTKPDNIRRKWRDKFVPIGDNLLRLRYFLDAFGYEVEELEALHMTVFNMGLVYAHRLVTMESLARDLSYSRDQVSRVLMGVRPLSPERKIVATNAMASHLSTAGVAHAELGTIRGQILDSRQAPIADGAPDPTVEAFAYGVRSLLPLAKALCSDRYTAADRQRVRELAGEMEFFNFSNLVNALCGERAFEAMKETGR